MEFSSSLNLLSSDTPLLLEKRIQLLISIDEIGSISGAAKRVPMSYKAAWDTITAMNNLAPTPVVVKETGGVGGGGATVTQYGKNLIATYTLLQQEHQKFLAQLTKMTDFNTGTLKSIQRFAMQISTQNQIQGVIKEIQNGRVNAKVAIQLKSGKELVSIVTRSAVESLEFKEGESVTAFFNASSVFVAKGTDLAISPRNRLQGTIEEIRLGEVNGEVVIDMGSDDKIISIITIDAIHALGLQKGMIVSAIIKSSDVMIGR